MTINSAYWAGGFGLKPPGLISGSIFIGVLSAALLYINPSEARPTPPPATTVAADLTSSAFGPKMAPPMAWMSAGDTVTIIEQHQDWRVTCARSVKRQRCALSIIKNARDGQRTLTLEFAAPVDRVLEGNFVLPLGMDLDAGAMIEVEGQSPVQAERYRTCFAAGCVLPVNLEPEMTKLLRNGRTLKLHLIKDGGDNIVMSVSLKGFGPALDRAVALSR